MFSSPTGLGGCCGKLITSADGNITCGVDAGGSADLTNVAYANQTNTFAAGQVIDNTSAVTDAYLNISDGNTPKFIVDSAGNVGIGTTGPNAKLQLIGTGGQQQIRMTRTDVAGGLLIGPDAGWIFTGAAANSASIESENGPLHLGGNGDNLAVTIKSGNVGINTTSPTQKVNVEGDANITGDVFLSTTGLASCSGKLITDSTGNITCGTDATGSGDLTNVAYVNQSNTFTPNQTFSDSAFITNSLGVGTASPSQALHVVGNGYFTGMLGVGRLP